MYFRVLLVLSLLNLFGLDFSTLRAQDTLSVWKMLDQAAQMDTVDRAKDKYEAAYTLAKQLDYDRGVLASLQRLIPLELETENTSNALRYLLEEVKLLENVQADEKRRKALIKIGDLYSEQALFTEAILYYKQAREGIMGNRNEETKSLDEKIGFNYSQEGEADSALVFYANLIELYGEDKYYRLNTLRKVVAAYQEARNYEASLAFNLQIKTLMEANQEFQGELGTIYNNLGYTHVFLGKYGNASQWFLKAEDHFENDHERLVVLYTNLGIAYFNNRDFKLATQYLRKALSLAKESDLVNKGNISNVLANIYLQTDDYFNAQNFNRDALEFADQSRNPQLKSDAYATAAEIHSRLYEYEDAIKAYKIHLGLRDSILIENRMEQERLFREKLALEKTEKEVKLLLIRGEIQDLTIAQLRTEKERQKLEIDNLNLDALKSQNEIEIMTQAKEIRETKLKNQELETQRTRQQLALLEGELELQSRERDLAELEKEEALTKAELERTEAKVVEGEQARKILEKDKELFQRNALVLILISLMILLGLVYTRKTNKKLRQQKLELEAEQEKSESLLLNILPNSVAQELKEKGRTTPKKYESVSILFSDFVDFTRISAASSPEEIIAELNDCFKGFDAIMEAEGIEKIQTIGDGYLAVGGIPEEAPGHAIKCVAAAKKMIAFLEERNQHSSIQWKARIGIHSGEITAGVVGTKKFAYNIFGDTVNTASRIETAGEQGRINISASTYDLIKERFDCEYRGKISAKGKGELDMYFVK
ncbi:MAG: adenylate/guanylate cyclase domain-containing protein [Bacteroidota bacterium]